MAAAFGREQRLKGTRAFTRVFGARCSAANEFLVVYAAANDLGRTRLGLTVGKQHGGAVLRNRIKRLLREAFRLEYQALPPGYDLVCIPRAGAVGTLADYRQAIRLVAAKAAARRRPRPRAK